MYICISFCMFLIQTYSSGRIPSSYYYPYFRCGFFIEGRNYHTLPIRHPRKLRLHSASLSPPARHLGKDVRFTS